MKKLAIFAALAAPVLLSSCSDKGYWDEYVPASVEYGIISADQTYTLNPELTTIAPFTLMVTRGTTVGDVSIPVSVSSDCSYLGVSAPASVNFTNGSSEAYITVNFAPDFAGAPWFNPVGNITLKLGTESIAPSSKGEWSAKVTFANSQEVGSAKLVSQLLAYMKDGGTPGAATVESTVAVWARAEDPSYIMLENPYGTAEAPHVLDFVLDGDWQVFDWQSTLAFFDMQPIATAATTPLYLSWGNQDSFVSDGGITLKFYTVTNADGSGYWPSQYQWEEKFIMPEGWNAVEE